ncbi:MAG: efflux RND transporter periplasmic adaptor subunit [Lamprobacter sp.]|uniref:efflux RND transporter periplasmic adaptor subunit n=1 Tax=Lamprobacter sp. TaxID=3100796 RepID=UPI002B256F9A|nr:efflux RND transporter periplasmic adaptor subunit [Lamprobacter sp.]MEA3639208.1 efflux RND transporter periplasmic adaptor subunit [Lamprobacter sp.]
MSGSQSAVPIARLLWMLVALTTVLIGCSEAPSGSTASRSRAPASKPTDATTTTSAPTADAATTAQLVTAITAERASVSMQHERPGSLRLRRLVRLHSQEEGRIIALAVFEGDPVQQGQTLLRLEDDLLQAELNAARATADQKRLDLKRLEALAGRGGASDDEIAQARTAVAVAEAQAQVLETRLAFTKIRAPFDGLLTARLVEPGDFVAKNTHLLSVADPTSLIAEVLVSELVLPQLSVGDAVQIRIDALGGDSFPGTILRIHPTLSESGRQAKVEVAFEQIPEGARSGQFVRIRFSSREMARLMVPFRSIRQERAGPFLWVIDADGKAARQAVETGLRITDQVEILAGLEPGTQVITRGFLGLAAGDAVRIIE